MEQFAIVIAVAAGVLIWLLAVVVIWVLGSAVWQDHTKCSNEKATIGGNLAVVGMAIITFLTFVVLAL